MLLQNGADPSLKVNDGFSLVHCAVKGGNTSIIHEPLSRDLDADSRSNDDFTPLMTVAIGDKESAFEMLIESGADPSLKDNKEFSVSTLLQKKEIHPLLMSCFYLVLMLIQGTMMASSLMIAADYDKKNAFEILIQNGADPSLKAKGGLSLLHFAAERERLDKSIL